MYATHWHDIIYVYISLIIKTRRRRHGANVAVIWWTEARGSGVSHVSLETRDESAFGHDRRVRIGLIADATTCRRAHDHVYTRGGCAREYWCLKTIKRPGKKKLSSSFNQTINIHLCSRIHDVYVYIDIIHGMAFRVLCLRKKDRTDGCQIRGRVRIR